MQRGRFITFEGGEGCGKSTQIRRLAAALAAAGKKVVTTREPGGTRIGEQVRALLKDEREDPPCARGELLLFLSARAQLVEKVIRPALAAGNWVLSDRFSDSTIAYQGYGRGLDLDFLATANAFVCDGLSPDISFLLDVDPATSRMRMRRREAATNTVPDRIEAAGEEFHRRLARGFRELAAAEPGRIVTIDGSGTVEEVGDRVWMSIKPLL